MTVRVPAPGPVHFRSVRLQLQEVDVSEEAWRSVRARAGTQAWVSPCQAAGSEGLGSAQTVGGVDGGCGSAEPGSAGRGLLWTMESSHSQVRWSVGNGLCSNRGRGNQPGKRNGFCLQLGLSQRIKHHTRTSEANGQDGRTLGPLPAGDRGPCPVTLAESGAGGRRQSWAVLTPCRLGQGANVSEGLTSMTPLGPCEAGTVNPYFRHL